MPPEILSCADHPVGARVFLVDDTAEGRRRKLWCERGPEGFTGGALGAAVARALRAPDDGRRVEVDPPPSSSWVDGAWLIVDTETTSLEDAKVIELGAVVMRQGRVLGHGSRLYNPGRRIDPGATAVHRITDAMVQGQPRITDRDPRTGRTPVESLDTLAAAHDVTAIVAYNGLSFDFPLLRRELGARWCELEAAVGLLIDPLVVVRLDEVGRWWRGKGRHTLTAVAERLELCDPEPGMLIQAHRASWDCVMAGRILWALREYLPTDADEARAMMASKSEQQRAELDAYFASQRSAGGTES